ncbi:MAG: hypothetical protein JO214_00945, partial [Frankiaceae bacterium]|nr:hypothetical protein [Frankiaceae bacterium]
MPVEYSSYWISADAGPDDEAEPDEFAPGFAGWQPSQVTVICSDECRGVDISVEVLESAPGEQDGDWQDVVEFEITTEDGDIRLVALMDGPKGPNLAPAGPGSYRFRLAATGRDPVDGKKPREQHQLQAWPVTTASPATIIQLTSTFAADWAAPEPPRKQIDWPALASEPGTRLIVGWRDLAPMSDEPTLLESTVVNVTDVLEGTPGQVFKAFHSPYLASIGGGGCSPVVELGGTFTCDVLHETYLPELDDVPPASWPWVGDLHIVGTWTDIQRFHTLALTLRFEDYSLDGDTRPAKDHPLPPGQVTFHFDKHPGGRQVTVAHHDVPRWLAEDVRRFWEIVLAA